MFKYIVTGLVFTRN